LTVVAAAASASLSAWRSRHPDASRNEPARRIPAGSSLGLDRSPDFAAAAGIRASILRLAWDAYRPVLLLAIGPTLLAAAAATARENPQFVMKTVQDASGRPAMTWARADEGVVLVGVMSLGDRLIDAALLAVTILANGAVAVGLGLAVATAIARPRVALAATIGLSLFVMIAGMLDRFIDDHPYALSYTPLGFLPVVGTLFTEVATHRSVAFAQSSDLAILGDIALALAGIGMLWLTVRVWQRRLLDRPGGRTNDELGADDERPAAASRRVVEDSLPIAR
jgi:hypothetical protein